MSSAGQIDFTLLRQHYPDGEQLHDSPQIWLFPEFASSEELSELMEAAWEQLQPAEVAGDEGGYLSTGRTGSNCWVPHNHNALTLALATRISELVQIPLVHAEQFQLVHYGPGQEYRAHYDAWDASTERGERCMARGGQRLVTTLLYLNHVEAGGATGFPKLELQVKPIPGTLLLFHNCHGGTNRKHDSTLHGGLPVLHGEKWAANLWFRERDYSR